MVSFQCDACGDVVKKPKLNQHRNRCHATFTCIDCSTTFEGTSYQSHTSCMTEAEKFQKHIYQNKKQNNNAQKNNKQPAAQQDKKDSSVNTKKPVSLIEQLENKKRKIEDKEEKSEKGTDTKAKKPKTLKSLAGWSATELDKDETKNFENAVKEVLKDGKPLNLRDVRKKVINLIEKHPKFKKSEQSDLKKAFDKQFKLKLKDNTITFAL